MKPEWCSEEIWNAAKDAAGEIYSGPMIYNDGCSIIARALLDAHKRGRREGMEEAAEECDRFAKTGYRLWAEDETDMAKLHLAQSYGAQSGAAAIRAKMEEQP